MQVSFLSKKKAKTFKIFNPLKLLRNNKEKFNIG